MNEVCEHTFKYGRKTSRVRAKPNGYGFNTLIDGQACKTQPHFIIANQSKNWLLHHARKI